MRRPRDDARTVLPGAGGTGGRADPGRLPRLAAPVLAFIDDMEGAQGEGRETMLLAEARAHLDRFETAALDEGERPSSVPPARYALAVLIDQKARSLTGVSVRRWSALARRQLFDGRDMSLDRIRGFRDTAVAQGAGYADLARFLDHLLDRADAARRGGRQRGHSRWPLYALGGLLALMLALAGYALAIEYRYQTRLERQFDAEALMTGLDRPGIGADLAARLDRLRQALDHVEGAAAAGPLGRGVSVAMIDPVAHAREVYSEAVDRHLAPVMAEAVGEVLATEGAGLALYDTLRAWAILKGEAEWNTDYLTGWLADRSEDRPGLAGLAPHVWALSGPQPALPAQDPELLDQARRFAREVDEPARAFLELRRSSEAAALAPWHAGEAVPGLEEVLIRRSGRPLSDPVPGLFTPAGWDMARDYGAGVAVQNVRRLAPARLGGAVPQVNDAPDKVMDVLQHETLAFWRDWLADLRVRPFGDREASVRISGLLAAADSPLTRLLRAVWVQAGGDDRSRNPARQLRLATALGPTIQYVNEGKMAEIGALFAALNVALAALDDSEDEVAAERLMSVQDRAASIEALKTAPLVVVQIVEDVLAQTSAAHSDMLGNPVTRRWQQAVLPLCRRTVEGRFPFAEGPDADLSDFAALLGPNGALTRFYASTLVPYLDTSTRPWRWKPEARLAGLSPETAGFFERALTAGPGFFDEDGALGATMSLATLAERGAAVMAVGGQGVPLKASGGVERLAWPGPDPAAGAEVAFRGEDGTVALGDRGVWGLLRLLDEVRVRRRDEGARLLVDFRTEKGRIFVEIAFPEPLNPVAARSLLKGLTCPTTL